MMDGQWYGKLGEGLVEVAEAFLKWFLIILCCSLPFTVYGMWCVIKNFI